MPKTSSYGLTTPLSGCFHELPQWIGDSVVALHVGFKRQTLLPYNFLTAGALKDRFYNCISFINPPTNRILGFEAC